MRKIVLPKYDDYLDEDIELKLALFEKYFCVIDSPDDDVCYGWKRYYWLLRYVCSDDAIYVGHRKGFLYRFAEFVGKLYGCELIYEID